MTNTYRIRAVSALLSLTACLLGGRAEALDRGSLTLYLPFENTYTPAVGPADTQIRFKDFILPDLGSFQHLTEDNKRYLEPDDTSPRKLEFVPGRRGLGLKAAANPTRFKVYSYPCVQYAACACFARKEGTVAFWMKPVGWSGCVGHLYFVAVTADNCTIRFYNYPGLTYVWIDTPKEYRLFSARGWSGWQDGQWSFLAFTYKPGQQCFYVDGRLLEKRTEGLIEPEFLNRGLVEISEGDQVVDELMVFNRALTAVEIAAVREANNKPE